MTGPPALRAALCEALTHLTDTSKRARRVRAAETNYHPLIFLKTREENAKIFTRANSPVASPFSMCASEGGKRAGAGSHPGR